MPIIFTLPGSIYKKDTVFEENYKGTVNTKSIGSLNCLLQKENWEQIFDCNDANTAYTKFLDIFMSLYDLCCPIHKVKEKRCNNTPWLTKGIINACHKKNRLYKLLLSQKTQVAKSRHVMYKKQINIYIAQS